MYEVLVGKYFRCNLPNGLGAIDGKRIVIQQSVESVVLLTVFGANANGRSYDAGIWQMSNFKSTLESVQNPLNIPSSKPLP